MAVSKDNNKEPKVAYRSSKVAPSAPKKSTPASAARKAAYDDELGVPRRRRTSSDTSGGRASGTSGTRKASSSASEGAARRSASSAAGRKTPAAESGTGRSRASSPASTAKRSADGDIGAARTRSSSASSRRRVEVIPEPTPEELEIERREKEETDSIKDEISIIISLLFSLLLVLSYADVCGNVGRLINLGVFGLLGSFGYVLPLVTFVLSVFCIANKHNRSAIRKVLYCILLLMFVTAIIQLTAGGFDPDIPISGYFFNSVPEYKGELKTYGGFLGGLICVILVPFVGQIASMCILVAMVLILFMLIAGKAIFTTLTVKGIIRVREGHRRRVEEREREAEELAASVPTADDLDGLDPDDEIFNIIPQNKKVRKDSFIDTLMRKGMGLEAKRIADTPEYQELLSPTEPDDTAPQDGTQSSAGTEDTAASGGRPVEEGPKEDKSLASDQEPDAPAEPGDDLVTDTPVLDLDIVASELDRKFGHRRKETPTGPVERHRINEVTNTRTLMADEDPEPKELPAAHLGQPAAQSVTERSDAGQQPAAPRTPARPVAPRTPAEPVAAQTPAKPAAERTDDDFEAACRDAWKLADRLLPKNTEAADASHINDNSVVSRADRRLQGPLHKEGAVSAAGRTSPAPRADSPADSAEVQNVSQPETAQKDRTSSGAVCFTDMSKAVPEEKKIPAYVFPPIDLLNLPKGPAKGVSQSELDSTVAKLQSTFESFGVGVKVTDATCGPTVTRYEITPEQGVKVKTITSLADDIKLALAAAEIRIEAPIPGKAAVGIEVPNRETSAVLLRELLESAAFTEAQSNLTFAVGKDIAGKPICFDIGSMPHMLIAGATGSGKSVCINALIMSILYKAKPSDVRMIMIDPKRVELIGYNGIPHLLVPVVTDVKKASGALNWAIAEMDDRYSRFADNGVNNLASYNRLMEERYYEAGNEGECPDRLPQIVIIVDELNDLMMTANGKEVEASICRLTQLARASGIHVVLATQRPSVNVITGTIKANIPSRIAFSVSSIVDSRTILDQAGAEKLLGKGDMLFYPQGYPKPVRLQGAYVSDKEVAEVVRFIKTTVKEIKYNDLISKHIDSHSAGDTKSGASPADSRDESSGDERDEFYEAAGKFIIEKQKASIGMLQRIYKIGFNRAARIMDSLADDGVVGPEEGTKPRKILMNLKQFEAFLQGGADDPGYDDGADVPDPGQNDGYDDGYVYDDTGDDHSSPDQSVKAADIDYSVLDDMIYGDDDRS